MDRSDWDFKASNNGFNQDGTWAGQDMVWGDTAPSESQASQDWEAKSAVWENASISDTDTPWDNNAVWKCPWDKKMDVTPEFWELLEAVQYYADDFEAPREFDFDLYDEDGEEDEEGGCDEKVVVEVDKDDHGEWFPSDGEEEDDDGDELFPSAANDEWQRLKAGDPNLESKNFERLLKMHGLENVKEHCLRVKRYWDQAYRHGLGSDGMRLSTVFVGNPGTGKTKVAKLFAKYLNEIELVKRGCVQITARVLLNGNRHFIVDQQIKHVMYHHGGVLIIDEAHQLTRSREILEYLLAQVEIYLGRIIFIFTGHGPEMEQFWSFDPGMPSRIPYTVHFDDYTDEEMLHIFVAMMKKKYRKRMKVEGGYDGPYIRAFIRRLTRARGSQGYGNVRTLENAWHAIISRQADRLHEERKSGNEPDEWMFTRTDLLGPEPGENIYESEAWKELDSLIGLTSVKKSLQAMMDTLMVNHTRELEGKKPIQLSLNKCFLGPPGCGKTTVAKLYGKILADIGLLSNGSVICKTGGDLIGTALGDTENISRRLLRSAVGNVLVIDEAHTLKGGRERDNFRTSAIDTLVAEIQNTPGEDRAVILLGYTDPMKDMLNTVNPGLARRFPIEDAFIFENFSDSELAQILELKLKKQHLGATDEAKAVALKLLSQKRCGLNFGNGGEVENLLNRAKHRYRGRISNIPKTEQPDEVVFEPVDFDSQYDRSVRAEVTIRELFAEVVGCEEVIEQLEDLQLTASGMQARGIDPRQHIPFTFVFKGKPGTGKSSTARKMGQVFYNMGLLASPDLIETSVTDLLGRFVGHTGPKTVALLEKSLGKVLFIDEAYRLGHNGSSTPGTYMQEAIDELVDCLTKPKFANNLVVILAGYEDEMDRLMGVNPGLSSRFPTEVVFPSLGAEDCVELLKKELGKLDIAVNDSGNSARNGFDNVQWLLRLCAAMPSWGNARDIQTLAKSLAGVLFKRSARDPSVEMTVEAHGIAEQLNKMLKSRRQRESMSPSGSSISSSPFSSNGGGDSVWSSPSPHGK